MWSSGFDEGIADTDEGTVSVTVNLNYFGVVFYRIFKFNTAWSLAGSSFLIWKDPFFILKTVVIIPESLLIGAEIQTRLKFASKDDEDGDDDDDEDALRALLLKSMANKRAAKLAAEVTSNPQHLSG